MATFSGGQANFGLTINGTPTKTNISGVATIGQANTRASITDGDIGYSVRAILATVSDELIIDIETNDTSTSTAWVAGVAQIETATCAGTVGTSGNAKAVISGTGFATQTVTFAVLAGDTPTAGTTVGGWALKARTAIAANTVIAALFDVGGATDKIILTRKPTSTISSVPIYPATIADLNIATDNDTSAGITTAATSAGTEAGTATSGTLIYDGDGKDWDGTAVDASQYWALFKLTAGSVSWAATNETGLMDCTGIAGGYDVRVIGGTSNYPLAAGWTFTAVKAASEITLTLIGTKA